MASKTFTKEFQEEEFAKLYSKHRPNIHKEVLQIIIEYLREKHEGELTQALDAGCGTGQCSIMLSEWFPRVIAIDASEAQIKEAIASRSADNIEYKVHAAEDLPVSRASIQLVTAGSSLHWFNMDSFFKEVRRVLVPGGVLAVYVQHVFLPYTEDAVKDQRMQEIVDEVYAVLLRHSPFAQKRYCDYRNNYTDIDFPFENVVKYSGVKKTFHGTMMDVTDFITTLVMFRTFQVDKGRDAAEKLIRDFRERLCDILEIPADGCENTPLTLRQEYGIVLCRKESNKCAEEYL